MADELLWGERERRPRGPKPGLSLDLIVRAAIDIADAEGIRGVSMQRVAAEFGFTTMSLYRYVPGKSELLDLMIDTAMGNPPDLSGITGGWRPRLAEWARLTWLFYERHPWFLAEAIQRRMGPNQLGWLETAVAVLSESGLAGEALLRAVLVVNGYVLSTAPFTTGSGSLSTDLGHELGHTIVDLVNTHRDRFPSLTAAVESGAFGSASEDDLEFGLALVLDGIEAYIERGAA